MLDRLAVLSPLAAGLPPEVLSTGRLLLLEPLSLDDEDGELLDVLLLGALFSLVLFDEAELLDEDGLLLDGDALAPDVFVLPEVLVGELLVLSDDVLPEPEVLVDEDEPLAGDRSALLPEPVSMAMQWLLNCNRHRSKLDRY